jgi:hypothetical protein
MAASEGYAAGAALSAVASCAKGAITPHDVGWQPRSFNMNPARAERPPWSASPAVQGYAAVPRAGVSKGDC